MQVIRCSNFDWSNVTSKTSKQLNRLVKAPQTLLFFKGDIYEFTHKKGNSYSQGQMVVLLNYQLKTG